MKDKSTIPIVDCNGSVVQNGSKIFDAISTVGFVYLKNFGISADEITTVLSIAEKFFGLPNDKKQLFSRSKNYKLDGNSGYVAPNVEILNSKSSSEIREAFNYRSHDTFKDEYFFEKCHCEEKSATTIRLLHYPPLPGHISPGTVKLGEHSDYGSITLLFQDNIGGLEVLGRNGQYIQAVPVPDTVLINTGDLLQRWTSDKLVATRHRVLVPENRTLWSSERYSLAYFVHPNDDVIVKPLDGSDKYEPVGAEEYLIQKFSKTY